MYDLFEQIAVIVVLPALRAVTLPFWVIFATLGFEEAHVILLFAHLSESVIFSPTESVAFFALIETVVAACASTMPPGQAEAKSTSTITNVSIVPLIFPILFPFCYGARSAGNFRLTIRGTKSSPIKSKTYVHYPRFAPRCQAAGSYSGPACSWLNHRENNSCRPSAMPIRSFAISLLKPSGSASTSDAEDS